MRVGHRQGGCTALWSLPTCCGVSLAPLHLLHGELRGDQALPDPLVLQAVGQVGLRPRRLLLSVVACLNRAVNNDKTLEDWKIDQMNTKQAIVCRSIAKPRQIQS